ncbi:MAG: hypothetical protein ABI318_15695 [Chthoniobacteraceae bacterium]
MKHISKLLPIITALLFASTALFAQDEKPRQKPAPKPEPKSEPKCCCTEDMKKMKAKIKAEAVELSKLVDEMNSSTGDKKVEAMAAIINKFAQEKKAMQEKMAAMHAKMDGEMKPECEAGKPADPHAEHKH